MTYDEILVENKQLKQEHFTKDELQTILNAFGTCKYTMENSEKINSLMVKISLMLDYGAYDDVKSD